MDSQDYFDADFISLPAEATVGDALAALRGRQAGDTWHIFIDLGDGQIGSIWVGTLRKLFAYLGADLFSLRLKDLPILVRPRIISETQAIQVASSRLRELARAEPAELFIIRDEAGQPIGRTWVASKDIFPGSTMAQLYGDYIDQVPDARARWQPPDILPPTCPHCRQQAFFRCRIGETGLIYYCERCGQDIPEGIT